MNQPPSRAHRRTVSQIEPVPNDHTSTSCSSYSGDESHDDDVAPQHQVKKQRRPTRFFFPPLTPPSTHSTPPSLTATWNPFAIAKSIFHSLVTNCTRNQQQHATALHPQDLVQLNDPKFSLTTTRIRGISIDQTDPVHDWAERDRVVRLDSTGSSSSTSSLSPSASLSLARTTSTTSTPAESDLDIHYDDEGEEEYDWDGTICLDDEVGGEGDDDHHNDSLCELDSDFCEDDELSDEDNSELGSPLSSPTSSSIFSEDGMDLVDDDQAENGEEELLFDDDEEAIGVDSDGSLIDSDYNDEDWADDGDETEEYGDELLMGDDDNNNVNQQTLSPLPAPTVDSTGSDLIKNRHGSPSVMMMMDDVGPTTTRSDDENNDDSNATTTDSQQPTYRYGSPHPAKPFRRMSTADDPYQVRKVGSLGGMINNKKGQKTLVSSTKTSTTPPIPNSDGNWVNLKLLLDRSKTESTIVRLNTNWTMEQVFSNPQSPLCVGSSSSQINWPAEIYRIGFLPQSGQQQQSGSGSEGEDNTTNLLSPSLSSSFHFNNNQTPTVKKTSKGYDKLFHVFTHCPKNGNDDDDGVANHAPNTMMNDANNRHAQQQQHHGKPIIQPSKEVSGMTVGDVLGKLGVVVDQVIADDDHDDDKEDAATNPSGTELEATCRIRWDCWA